ncbi:MULTISPECIES: hypothetical protein [Cellulomonas]|uniref:hypothetical protein n=1 Tax=Cellulomonas TaxID=1707 RepID=UPI000625C694|nr:MULTISPECIES: hypothetical protein [Cellulomonas]UCN14847.1 hypothetical protein LFM56_00510 [Cellulomonas iranensis]
MTTTLRPWVPTPRAPRDDEPRTGARPAAGPRPDDQDDTTTQHAPTGEHAVARAARPADDRAAGPCAGAVPCAARPGTPLHHPDGACRCFAGGPRPEFLPTGGAPG